MVIILVLLLYCSEFEGYYWAEAKKRLQQKKQDNLKLVSLPPYIPYMVL